MRPSLPDFPACPGIRRCRHPPAAGHAPRCRLLDRHRAGRRNITSARPLIAVLLTHGFGGSWSSTACVACTGPSLRSMGCRSTSPRVRSSGSPARTAPARLPRCAPSSVSPRWTRARSAGAASWPASGNADAELRVIPVERLLNLLQPALLVFWEWHDAPPKRENLAPSTYSVMSPRVPVRLLRGRDEGLGVQVEGPHGESLEEPRLSRQPVTPPGRPRASRTRPQIVRPDFLGEPGSPPRPDDTSGLARRRMTHLEISKLDPKPGFAESSRAKGKKGYLARKTPAQRRTSTRHRT
jgi:hypothetical protein